MPLTTVKRSRDRTAAATNSFNMVKRPRPSNATLLVELPPIPSIDFIGLSPITSFLSSSSHSDFSLSSSASTTDESDNQDELLEHRIVPGLNYDGHRHQE